MKVEQEHVSEPESADTCLGDNDIEPLSGKPFFHTLLLKSHVTQNQLLLPVNIMGLLPVEADVPVILNCGNRSWEMKYFGNHSTQSRFGTGWRAFIDDNMLKIGDVCVFELMSCESSLIKFKVQILRGDLPSTLLDRVGAGTHSSPVVIENE